MIIKIKTVCVWGDDKLPEGYNMLGVLILDPIRDLYFVVGAPTIFVVSASQFALAKVLSETIERELLNAADHQKIR